MTNGPVTMWIPESAGNEVTLLAAATVDIGVETSPRILISGSGETITSFGSEVNRLRFVRWDGANTLSLPGATPLATQDGDGGLALSDVDGNFVYYPFFPGSSQPVLTTKTADYTLTAVDEIATFDCSAGELVATVTRSLGSATRAKRFWLGKRDSSGNALIIQDDALTVIDVVVTPANGQAISGRWIYVDGTSVWSQNV